MFCWWSIRVLVVVFGQFIEICIMNWFCCVFGRVYVFFIFRGFWVVMMRNGLGSGCVVLLIVIWFFFMVLSRVDCVFGDEWLILLVIMMCVNIVLCLNLNLWLIGLQMEMLVMLFGSRLGVNWIWCMVVLMLVVRVWVSIVLFILGMFLISR